MNGMGARKAHTRAYNGDILLMQPTTAQVNVLTNKIFRISQTVSDKSQCKDIALCQEQTPPLHTLRISSFFIYLLMKDHVKYQRRIFLQQQKTANQGLFYPMTVPISNNALFEKRNTYWNLQKTHTTLGEYRFLSPEKLEK